MRYYLFLILLAAVLLGGTFAVFHFAMQQQPGWPIYVVFGFLLLLTVAMHAVLMNALEKKPSTFVNLFMGLMSGKMFLSAIALVVLIMTNRDQAIPIGVSFLVAYLGFTVVEVVTIRKASAEASRREKAAKADSA